MEKTNRAGITQLAIVVLALTAIAIIATFIVTSLVTEAPRSFITWTLTGFFCLVWFVIGMMNIQNIATKRYQYTPSGATMVFVWLMIGLYAFLGLLTIISFMLFIDVSEARDRMLMGVLIGGSVIFFIVAFYFYSFSLHSEDQEHVTMVKRAEHRAQSFSLSEVIAGLKSINTDGPKQLGRMDIFLKKVRTIETALKHSHGGGVGSYEGGGKHWGNMAAETREIEQLIGTLDDMVKQFRAGEAGGFDEVMSAMDQTMLQLESAIASCELA